MRLNINLKISKRAAIITATVLTLAATATIFYLSQWSHNPLPPEVKRQLGYRVLYPSKTSRIDPASYDYQTDKKTLTFSVNMENQRVVFTEQPAPDNLGQDGQVYYPALGIHPYAQFKTKLGTVALTKFWQSGSLKPVGQSGILASNGTVLIAHSEESLTNAEWKDLFDSLVISK